MKGLKLFASTILAVPMATVSFTAVLAQTAPAPADAGLQEVVVTARHRTEVLQEVPIAVSVVNGDLAMKENRNNISDLVATLPSVNFRAQPSFKDQDVVIRGLGTISTSAGVEAAVSTVVDGVVLMRPGQMTSDILDLDHIEVLRGPQGTLFGKNSSAGVINVVTKNPGWNFAGYADAAYYEGDEHRFSAGISGPVVDNKVAASISGIIGDYDGNVKNLYNNTWDNGYTRRGMRAKLLYEPTDSLSIVLGADYMHSTESTMSNVFIATSRAAYPTDAVTKNPGLATLLAGAGITPSYSNTTINQQYPTNDVDDTYGVVAEANWTFDDYVVTSITGWRGWKNVQTGFLSGLPAITAAFPQELDLGHVAEHQTSEELRLASPKGQGNIIDYVVGAYFMLAPDDEQYMRTTTQLVSGKDVVNSGLNHFGAHFGNESVFGEGNINITDNLRVIAGLRGIHDDLSYYTHRVATAAAPGIGASFGDAGSTSLNGYADRGGLQYDVNQDIHTYFTYSRGYKGPAYNVFFNEALTNTGRLNPETSDSFEVGAKTSFFDRKLTFDVAAFHAVYNNYQANVLALIDGVNVTNLINAGKVGTQGVEIDSTAKLTRDLTLVGAFTYDYADVINFNCPPNSPSSCFINGQPLPFAPRFKLDGRADYAAWKQDQYDVMLSTDYSWQSSEQFTLSETPDTIQGPYGIWNARVTFDDNEGNWDLSVQVKNILDRHYYAIIGAGGETGLTGIVPRDFSRYWGVSVHKSF